MGRWALPAIGLALVLGTGPAMVADLTVIVDQIHSAQGKVYVPLWGGRAPWLGDPL